MRFFTQFGKAATQAHDFPSYFKSAWAGVIDGRRVAIRCEEVLHEL